MGYLLLEGIYGELELSKKDRTHLLIATDGSRVAKYEGMLHVDSSKNRDFSAATCFLILSCEQHEVNFLVIEEKQERNEKVFKRIGIGIVFEKDEERPVVATCIPG